MEAGTLTAPGGRSLDERPSSARLADPVFQWGLRVLAALILGLIAFFFYFLIKKAHPALDKFGVFGFTFGSPWDVSRAHFGAWPLLAGTLISSAIALVIGLPGALAASLYVTRACPHLRRSPLARPIHVPPAG